MKNKHDRVLVDYTLLELHTMSCILNDWSTAPLKADVRWNNRMPALRSGIIAGYAKRQRVPPEIIQQDHGSMVTVVEFLIKNMDTNWNVPIDIPYRIRDHAVIRRLRVDPMIKSLFKKMLNNRCRTPQSTASHLVSMRLGISKKSIDKHLRATPRIRPNPGHDLAVSVYLDHVSRNPTKDCVNTQIKLLAHLKASGYPDIGIYYLVKCTQTLVNVKYINASEDTNTMRVCNVLTPSPDREILSRCL